MAKITKGEKTALVTSATHMPRAMALFSFYGEQPIPAPAMYLAKDYQYSLPSYAYIPSANQLYKSQVASHEYLGLIFNWLSGKK